MSEAKHTPGPWEEDGLTIYQAGTNVMVAEVQHNGLSSDTRAANASLIAAAPDLLETLEAIKALALPGATHIHAVCDAALAKAKGGPP